MNGLIFNIQRFSIHDGPGIRTTVFLKGCNLKCKWCHNPESINMKQELQYFENKCSICGKCVMACEQNAISFIDTKLNFDRTKCISCFKCCDACYNNARCRVGEFKDSNEVMEIVLKDKAFYENSGGGVTFSGGEPLLQYEMILEMLKIAKLNKINTAIETAGNVDASVISSVINYTDLFLYDFKIYNSQKHKAFTNSKNDRILNNLIMLSEKKADVLIRIPIIPGVNDDIINLQNTAEFILNNTCFKSVELLAFHNLAESKYKSLGIEYHVKDYQNVTKEKILELSDILRKYGIDAIIHN